MISKEFYTTGEAAELLNISRSTVSRKFDRAMILGEKNPITGERRISRESLLALVKRYNLPMEGLGMEKKKVLLGTADDRLFSRFQKIFGKDDRVKVERENHGGDVLARCSKERLDLLVIDEELLDIPTAEVIRSLRRQEEQKRLKILCLTGGQSPIRALGWGADEAFGKETLDQKDLIGRIYSFLGLSRRQPEIPQTFDHQRRWLRVPKHLPARIEVYRLKAPNRRDPGKAVVENISCGGAHPSEIEVKSGQIPCEPFRILMEVDKKPLKGWRAHCMVARLQVNDSLTVGVQFVKLSKSNLQMIQAISEGTTLHKINLFD